MANYMKVPHAHSYVDLSTCDDLPAAFGLRKSLGYVNIPTDLVEDAFVLFKHFCPYHFVRVVASPPLLEVCVQSADRQVSRVTLVGD